MLTLTQGEFTSDRPDKKPLSWQVPVIAQTVGSATSARTLVTGGKATLEVPGCGVVVVNAGQSGYYRTLYSPEQFAAIKSGFAKLAPIDQLGILNDTASFGWAGLLPVSNFLDLAQATPADADPQIWSNVADSFDSIDSYYDGDVPRQNVFRAFAIARLAPVLARVGWTVQPGELVPVTDLRTKLIGTLSALGDPAVIAEARRRYAAQSADPNAVPVALRKTILGVVARHADATAWDQLHAAAQAEKTPLIRDELYWQLSTTEDEALARRALALAITDEPGATTSPEMIQGVSRLHPMLAFDFAMAHLAEVDTKVDKSDRSYYYPRLGRNSLDPAMIGKLKAYADAHVTATSRHATDIAIAMISYRIKVRNERLPAVDAWLKSNGH